MYINVVLKKNWQIVNPLEKVTTDNWPKSNIVQINIYEYIKLTMKNGSDNS